MTALNSASAPMAGPVVLSTGAPADVPPAGCWFAGCCAIVDREGPVRIDANATTSITRLGFLMADSPTADNLPRDITGGWLGVQIPPSTPL